MLSTSSTHALSKLGVSFIAIALPAASKAASAQRELAGANRESSLARWNIRRRRRRLALLAAAAVLGGCVPHTTREHALAASRPTLLLENATEAPVRVYLVVNGTEWLLGHLAPSALGRLPLPQNLVRAIGAEVTVVAVPLGGGSLSGRQASRARKAVRSQPELLDELPGMYWVLSGAQLVSYPRQ